MFCLCAYLHRFLLTYYPIRLIFPLRQQLNQKGIVYLCRGTGGSAQNLVGNFEWQQMINDLVHAGYSIVVTEAEEVTLNQDLNSDGKIRWERLPADTLTNIDYANIRVLSLPVRW